MNTTNVIETLKHITWTLNININIIGLKYTQRYQFIKCVDHSRCFFPFYIFQNTIVKLITNEHPNIVISILYFKKKYYIMQNQWLCPQLIQNFTPSNNLNLLMCDIVNIIKNKIVPLPFTLHIYSSYEYCNKRSESKLINMLIGSSFNTTNEIIHYVFLTPSCDGRTVLFYSLNFTSNPPKITTKNYLSYKHNTESIKLCQSKTSTNINEPLNQNFCICDHPNTNRFFSPGNHSFSPLASKTLQKYFLYENLGKCRQ